MKAEEYISPFLDNLKKQERLSGHASYRVPGNYFNQLNTILLSAVKEEDRRQENNNLLNALSKKALSNPPEGYFENLEGEILKKVRISASKAPFLLKRWHHIAAAAIITAITVLSIIKYFPEITSSEKKYSETAIQNISSNELTDFVNGNTTVSDPEINDENQLFNNISSQELQNFLNETGTDGILN